MVKSTCKMGIRGKSGTISSWSQDETVMLCIRSIQDDSGASEALTHLCRIYDGALSKVALRSGIGFEESKLQAVEGLWEAAKRFDIESARGRNTFLTYAYFWMRKKAGPRTETRSGRLDKPSKVVLSDFDKDDGGSYEFPFRSCIGSSHYGDAEMVRTRMDIEDAMSRLSGVTRRVAVLRFVERRSFVDICRVTGLSDWSVRSAISKAHGFLKLYLSAYA